MTDEAQIRGLLRASAEAWNAGDARAYADVFTEDADFITWYGAHCSGRQSIEDTHRSVLDGPMKGSKLLEGGEPRVRFLSRDVALVIITDGGVSTVQAGNTLSLTAVREPDGWRLASCQNTRKSDPTAG